MQQHKAKRSASLQVSRTQALSAFMLKILQWLNRLHLYVRVCIYRHIYIPVSIMSATKRLFYKKIARKSLYRYNEYGFVVVGRFLPIFVLFVWKRRWTGLCHFSLFWLPFRMQFIVDLIFFIFSFYLNSRLTYSFGDTRCCCNAYELASVAFGRFWTWAVANRLPSWWYKSQTIKNCFKVKNLSNC